MRSAIRHSNTWLMPGSVAHRLHTEGKTKELAAHMCELDNRERLMLASADRAEKAMEKKDA